MRGVERGVRRAGRRIGGQRERREEQGENSSALQLADSMFSTAALAIAGSLFAALVMESQTVAYLASFAVAFVLAAIGFAGAGRVRSKPVERTVV